ncbi:Dihydroorotate dehydrogenase B (NAD(+)), catalytic subunit [Poriferisphaera corsica]|uniref:Dihydroorotate dehydrogenase B (NAD(+)), catalytic subunit n=1 Tax=Poriferisphaera corsica TaxID=2528020 RepID=A0A517YPG3_9BACT|nr:dihydroorotate dehydrogenase-like protein [Poriferisphaera corsica]QDU32115.1 Dihydroorotate dehydrogenase B (NAD(+)), catalytic subunit [Poriferisphaera corsica]
MDLRTNYLGFELDHPIIPGASPLCYDIEFVRELVDAGAPMIVMRSLFEEDIRLIQMRQQESNHDSASLTREPIVDPSTYLKQIEHLKREVHVPIVASINGATPGGWTKYAIQAINAGADAIELNLYRVATERDLSSEDIEAEDVQIVSELTKRINVPLAVKISQNYTSLSHYSDAIRDAGAQALVIFNRFMQPDIDIETRTMTYRLNATHEDELRLRLRWAAILSSHGRLPIGITGGVKSSEDVIKAVMCGASTCQVVTPFISEGVGLLSQMVKQLEQWCESHQIDTLGEIRGCMNLSHAEDKRAYERGNYLQILKSAAYAVQFKNKDHKLSKN